MIIGAFSDAHGNETGFNICLDYLSANADKIFYLGDSVGYFPLSNSIIDTLRESEIVSLKGNHEAMLLGEMPYDLTKDDIYRFKESLMRISEKNKQFLQGLKPNAEFVSGGRKLLFLHGGPLDNLNQYVYADSDTDCFEALDYDVVFMGHTHRPFIKKAGNKILLNTGSCGLPRNTGNRLSCILYNSETREAVIHEFELDTAQLIKQYEGKIHKSVINVLTRNTKEYEG